MKIKNSIITLYIKDRLKGISNYVTFIIIFSIVFYLYKLPLETILYSVIICGFVASIMITYDFYKYNKNHQALRDVKNNIRFTIDSLKEPKTLIERDYQGLIKILYADKKTLILEKDKKHTDLIEYFTLWTHQVKTPLSAVNLLVQLREDEKEDIEKQLFEIEQYVDMALQFLRIEDMSNDLKLEEYSLDRIVKQAIKSYSRIFIYKDIGLRLDDININIITDEKWLLFALKQIISNSLKYTNEGYIRIYLEDEDTLIIQDTGIGINEEDIPRIFEKGFTGYNGRMDKKSTGLGLHLTRNVLDKLGHRISIISKADQGTIIKIDLSCEELEIK